MSGGVQVGRNDPCPCGSGRKYKRCCFAADRERSAAEAEAVAPGDRAAVHARDEALVLELAKYGAPALRQGGRRLRRGVRRRGGFDPARHALVRLRFPGSGPADRRLVPRRARRAPAGARPRLARGAAGLVAFRLGGRRRRTRRRARAGRPALGGAPPGARDLRFADPRGARRDPRPGRRRCRGCGALRSPPARPAAGRGGRGRAANAARPAAARQGAGCGSPVRARRARSDRALGGGGRGARSATADSAESHQHRRRAVSADDRPVRDRAGSAGRGRRAPRSPSGRRAQRAGWGVAGIHLRPAGQPTALRVGRTRSSAGPGSRAGSSTSSRTRALGRTVCAPSSRSPAASDFGTAGVGTSTRFRRRSRRSTPVAILPEPPAELAPVLLELKRRHYADWADQPLPALAGRTPRQAVRTPAGRREVDLLLKEMENHEQRSGDSAPFDFAPLRRDLALGE